MDFILLLIAFIFGFACKIVKMPPLIGYLIAGFVLNGLGFSNNENLSAIADLGITIMLFTIGLKLNVKDLAKAEIWLASVSHSLIWINLLSFSITLFSIIALPYFTELSFYQSALVGFAFSFSSTVCVVKILEESGESRTRHGKVAIGILVMQDIFAVMFLVAATGKIPSIYALNLFLLIPLAPLLRRLLEEAGHGELLPLSGMVFALGGYFMFDALGVKGDLGALILGVMLAPSFKASELSKSLLSFKDLFLIGFFLTIGLTALPDLEMTLIALLFMLFIPLKFVLFFAIFAGLKLRVRTSFLSSLVMSNYSEFGLIVVAVAVSAGMLDSKWLVIMALAVSFSFVVTSLFYKNSHDHYNKLKGRLKRYQRQQILIDDQYPDMQNAEILVIGMGRVGKSAFNALSNALGSKVWGMDADAEKINKIQNETKEVLNTIVGDGENIDLWESIDISNVQLVLLALPSIEDSANITSQLRSANYQAKIAAIARYADEVEPLTTSGVDKVFNFFTDAGLGFAEESFALLAKNKEPLEKPSAKID
jgi:predicted Kef-type K+ transport protein